MALSTDPGSRLFRYADLANYPNDNLRREIIDGELVVTAAPATRHQLAVGNIFLHLKTYIRSHGGQVFAAPTDVYLTDDNVVEPDVLYLEARHVDQIEDKVVRGRPDLVVEVSSPTTRHLELSSGICIPVSAFPSTGTSTWRWIAWKSTVLQRVFIRRR